MLCCTKDYGGCPHAGVGIAARAAAPISIVPLRCGSRRERCGAPEFAMWGGLIFLLAAKMAVFGPASAWFARGLSAPADCSFHGQDSCFFILVCLSRPCHRGCSLCFGHHRLHSAAESTGACTASFTKLAQRSIQLDASDKCALHAHALPTGEGATTRTPYETPRIDAIDATPGQCRTPRTRRYHARATTSIAHGGAPRVVAETERPERHEGCCGARARRRRRAQGGK